MKEEIFKCKQFNVTQTKSTMKVNTDAILLGAWVDVQDAVDVLDVGTGTGIIALMIAQRIDEQATIKGIEIDDQSAEEAEKNFKNSPWSDRLHAINQSIQEFSQKDQIKYDLIVSNPPFYTGGTFSDNENKNNVRHAVKLSHGDLLIASSRLLTNGGKMALILPFLEGERFIERAERMGFSQSRITEVRSKPHLPIERLLIELVKNNAKTVVERSQLVLLKDEKDRIYTNEYKNLTSEFYTIF